MSTTRSNATLPESIQRYAMNINGRIGSLYDALNDEVLDWCWMISGGPFYGCFRPDCVSLNGGTAETQNLLRMIGVDEESRASSILQSPTTKAISWAHRYDGLNNQFTRFIHYRRVECNEYVNPTGYISSIYYNLASLLKANKSATHIITSVTWGVDVIIIVQLSDRTNVAHVDAVLYKLRQYLLRGPSDLNREEQSLIRDLKPIVYTNVPFIQRFRDCSLYDLCKHIRLQIPGGTSTNVPLQYGLSPVTWYYRNDELAEVRFFSIQKFLLLRIESVMLHLLRSEQDLLSMCDSVIRRQSPTSLKHQMVGIKRQREEISSMMLETRYQLRAKLAEMRQGKIHASAFAHELTWRTETMQKHIDDLAKRLKEMSEKLEFVHDLQKTYGIEYVNVLDPAQPDADENNIIGRLLERVQQEQIRVLCVTDILRTSNMPYWSNFCKKPSGKTSTIRRIYADFSYCPFALSEIKILPPPSEHLPPQSKTKRKEINILLLGETGVGKSTFINAFVNYLAFDTLEQARIHKPIVLIPVSFLIMINDKFDEFHVKIGDADINEDHDHPGQSVTQQCKSYVFDIDDQTQLRIIDTPGIGDTRGLNQDDMNIQQILSYVSSLSHINAVCILLKPNTSRINVFFRLCFTQLFDFLGPDIRDNILFCFTNARSTFFVPGNTAPLLKQLLTELPGKPIPFSKRNTFCFDSESFRYLAAMSVPDKILLNDIQRNEYEKSWINSVAESGRLFGCIQQLKDYPTRQWQSAKRAQHEILILVRPMIETMRNILRNLISVEEKLEETICLRARSISRPSSLCTTCDIEKRVLERFHYVPDRLHDYATNLDRCNTCSCPPAKHIPVYYELGYKSCRTDQLQPNSNESLKKFIDISAQFTQFLFRVVGTSHDPFLPGIMRAIAEEEKLHSSGSTLYLNAQFSTKLRKLKIDYEQQLQTQQAWPTLEAIYMFIEQLQSVPMMKVQMDAVRRSQLRIAKQQERHIARQQIRNSACLTLNKA